MDAVSVFEFDSYKAYLRALLPGLGRGARTAMARHLHCQTTFVSQVLNGSVHFSLEHAVGIARFLKHTEDERSFFMSLVQLGRAGSSELEGFFRSQIRVAREKRKVIQERLGITKGLKVQDQAIYYGSWIYAAIHIALSVPEFRTPDAIARALGLSSSRVVECLQFLERTGLAQREGQHYTLGSARIHLGKDSPLLPRHHANWRGRAMDSIDSESRTDDVHYSLVMGLGRADAEKIRGIFLQAIQSSEKALVDAPREESVYALNLDFFDLVKS